MLQYFKAVILNKNISTVKIKVKKKLLGVKIHVETGPFACNKFQFWWANKKFTELSDFVPNPGNLFQ